MGVIVRDTTTNEVVGRQSGNVAPNYPAPRQAHVVTDAEYNEISTKGLRYPHNGPARWSHDGTTLVEVPDDRFVVSFSPATYEPDAPGNGQETITVTTYQSDGTTQLTNFNQVRHVRTNDGFRLRLAFSGGVATFSIPRGTPRIDAIRGTSEFRIQTNDPAGNGYGEFYVDIPRSNL